MNATLRNAAGAYFTQLRSMGLPWTAIGYPTAGFELDPDGQLAIGLNHSRVHEDVVVGSGELHITGIGATAAVIRCWSPASGASTQPERQPLEVAATDGRARRTRAPDDR